MINRLTIIFCFFIFVPFTQAETAHVAVASNFAEPMKRLAIEFEKQTQHKLVLSFGSSGKIFAQIRHGAPFDIFLSADQDKAKKLEQAGLVVKGSRFTYALGVLYLWSPTVESQQALLTQVKEKNFSKLALANPKLAPYGIAAVEALHSLRLANSTKDSWVIGENIAQTYQFVNSGNASLGFVAASQVSNKKHSNKGYAWQLPESFYNKISQDAILLKKAAKNTAAESFLRFLRSKNALAIIKSYGYKAVSKHKKEVLNDTL